MCTVSSILTTAWVRFRGRLHTTIPSQALPLLLRMTTCQLLPTQQFQHMHPEHSRFPIQLLKCHTCHKVRLLIARNSLKQVSPRRELRTSRSSTTSRFTREIRWMPASLFRSAIMVANTPRQPSQPQYIRYHAGPRAELL